MFQLTFFVLSFIFYGAVDGKFNWYKCPEIIKTETFDFKLARGEWYLYADSSYSFGKCYNYSLTFDAKLNKYIMGEKYVSKIFKSEKENNYNVEVEPDSDTITLTKKIFGLIPISTSWRIMTSKYSDFLLLYKCNWLSAQSQIWVRNKDTSVDFDPVMPKDFQQALAKINFKPDDYLIKTKSDCNIPKS